MGETLGRLLSGTPRIDWQATQSLNACLGELCNTKAYQGSFIELNGSDIVEPADVWLRPLAVL